MGQGKSKEPDALLDAVIIGTILNASREELLKTVPEEDIKALRAKIAHVLDTRLTVVTDPPAASNLLPLIRPSTRPNMKDADAKRGHARKLADLNRTTTQYLIRKFDEIGVRPWWNKTTSVTKGGAAFFLYDPIMTCLRLLPGSPKIFQASLRSGIISGSAAVQVNQELMTTMRLLLPRYSGHFAAELRSGCVGQTLAEYVLKQDKPTGEPSLLLDEMAASMPWPFLPSVHLKRGKFTACGIQPEYLAAAGEDPLRALSMALDLANLGPSFGLSPEALIAIIKALRGGRKGVVEADLARGCDESADLRKIVIPAFTHGFQGVAIATFNHLHADQEDAVIGLLHQYTATLGEEVASFREKEAKRLLRRAHSLLQSATALMSVLPPTEHVVFSDHKEQIGFRLKREGEFLAGYRPMEREEIRDAISDPRTEAIAINDLSKRIELHVKMPSEADDLNPLFTMLRLRTLVHELQLQSIEDEFSFLGFDFAYS